MDIKCNLSVLRKELRGMSQAELSKATGIAQGRISEMESKSDDLGYIKLETACKLASALNCSLDELFIYENGNGEKDASSLGSIRKGDLISFPYTPDKSKWLNAYAKWVQLVMDTMDSAVALGSTIERCIDNIDLVPYEELLGLNFSYIPLMEQDEAAKFAYYLKFRYRNIPRAEVFNQNIS